MSQRQKIGGDYKDPVEDWLDDRHRFIPTGSTMLNLCLSNNPYGGFAKGTTVNIIGDSSSGKSFLLWSLFAECVHMKRFEDYFIYYDEPERALQFQLVDLFGANISRVELETISYTIQDFYKNVKGVIADGDHFVYGLDSFDSLTSEEELERDSVGKGGWKTEKASGASEMLRQITKGVYDTGSLIAIISQTRQNIGKVIGSAKCRSGGDALKFYSTHELWLRITGHMERKGRKVGVWIRASTTKNKLTGRLRSVSFPIMYDYGVDDIGSMIDFLVDENFWIKPKNHQKIDTKGDFIDGKRETIIRHIEDNNLEEQLIEITGEAWMHIEEEIKTKRKPKYSHR